MPPRSQAVLRVPRKLQHDARLLQGRAARRADGHGRPPRKLVLRRARHPLPFPASTHAPGISCKRVPNEDIWCLLAKQVC